MKKIAIIQARLNSTRLPGKVMFNINGMPLIEILYKRLKRSKELDDIVIATNKKSKELIKFLKKKKINYFIGSENNVLNRYYKAAEKYQADIIIRLTADGVLADPVLVDQFIKKYKSLNVDYLCNSLPLTYPDGLDFEIFNFKSLKNANFKAKKLYDKEHVTPFIINNSHLKKHNIINKEDSSNIRLTLDEVEDFETLKNIFKYFYPNIHFSWKKVVSSINRNRIKH